jgi:glutamate-1-semialdehyde 2,1-aminomutase
MTAPEDKSQELWQKAKRVIPGGVNSPVRAFGAVGGDPVFVESGAGSIIRSVDGVEYADYVTSWGALILGHAHPTVVEAAQKAVERGMTFGMPTEAENVLAEKIVECVPSLDKVRMVSSGTEAVMSAIRLARGFTGRDLIVKFEGGYHGHSDGLLAAAGSGVATFAIPGTKGVPASYTEKTIVVPYNNREAIGEVFDKFGKDIACVIIEPVAGNMGVVPPAEGFLQFLRETTEAAGSLLLFDEVITGFRLGLSGAQGLYGITPDITTLGKIIGGGMPAAAYGGRADIMDALSPNGPVYQAGTLSGNPVAMATGLATLELLIDDPPYEQLDSLAGELAEGLRDAAAEAGIAIQQNRVGSMQTLFFTDTPVTDYSSAMKCDTDLFGRFFHGMLDAGVHLAPSQFEAAFVSTAHTSEQIEQTIASARGVMKELA